MKRRELLRYVESHECFLEREGAEHSVYVNSKTREWTAIGRHSEIHQKIARKICKDLGIPPPRTK